MWDVAMDIAAFDAFYDMEMKQVEMKSMMLIYTCARWAAGASGSFVKARRCTHRATCRLLVLKQPKYKLELRYT